MAGEERSSGGSRGSSQEPQTGEWRLWRPCQSSQEGKVFHRYQGNGFLKMFSLN